MISKNLWTRLSSVFLCLIGLILIITSNIILKLIIQSKLVLTPNSKLYNMWQHFPVYIPTEIYLFNWTNPENIYDLNIKPKFQELGPYKYNLELSKTDIKWNANGTISYKPQKFWYYVEDEDNGNLQDNVTFANGVALTAAYIARHWGYLGRKATSLSLTPFLNSLYLTKTVDEVLFTGYPEPVLKLANSIPVFAGLGFPPIDRFGWFYQRNGTDLYDAGYNVGTGINSVLGKIYRWNYLEYNPFLEKECSSLDASAGEFFRISGNYVKLFSLEFCRAILLEYEKDEAIDGIMGKKYVLGEYMLDNGTKYPENKCYCNGNCIPSGIFNVSACRFGTPGFASLPHFYKADPYYINLVEGLKPNKTKHDFYIIIEPNTGLPLKFVAGLQLNMLLESVPGMALFESAHRFYVPIVWLSQNLQIPKSEVSDLKQLLSLPLICKVIGGVLILIGIILFFVVEVLQRKKKYKECKTQEIIVKQPEQKHLL